MPFTPYHFGPGLLLKALLREHFSFAAYTVTQVVIDVETLYHLQRREWPVHRVLHTCVVGSLAGAAIGGALAAVAPRVLPPSFVRDPDVARDLRRHCALVGGIIGGASHALVDAIMHRDVTALWPFSNAHVLHGLLAWPTIHALCIASGAIGLALLALIRYQERHEQTG
ncbi:MAG: DUF4184 family protein [Planctomycetota bacterium]